MASKSQIIALLRQRARERQAALQAGDQARVNQINRERARLQRQLAAQDVREAERSGDAGRIARARRTQRMARRNPFATPAQVDVAPPAQVNVAPPPEVNVAPPPTATQPKPTPKTTSPHVVTEAQRIAEGQALQARIAEQNRQARIAANQRAAAAAQRRATQRREGGATLDDLAFPQLSPEQQEAVFAATGTMGPPQPGASARASRIRREARQAEERGDLVAAADLFEAAERVEARVAGLDVGSVREAQGERREVQAAEVQRAATLVALEPFRRGNQYDLDAALESGIRPQALVSAGFSQSDVGDVLRARATRTADHAKREAALEAVDPFRTLTTITSPSIPVGQQTSTPDVEGLSFPGVSTTRQTENYDLVAALQGGVSQAQLRRAGFPKEAIERAARTQNVLKRIGRPDLFGGFSERQMISAVRTRDVTLDDLRAAGFPSSVVLEVSRKAFGPPVLEPDFAEPEPIPTPKVLVPVGLVAGAGAAASTGIGVPVAAALLGAATAYTIVKAIETGRPPGIGIVLPGPSAARVPELTGIPSRPELSPETPPLVAPRGVEPRREGIPLDPGIPPETITRFPALRPEVTVQDRPDIGPALDAVNRERLRRIFKDLEEGRISREEADRRARQAVEQGARRAQQGATLRERQQEGAAQQREREERIRRGQAAGRPTLERLRRQRQESQQEAAARQEAVRRAQSRLVADLQSVAPSLRQQLSGLSQQQREAFRALLLEQARRSIVASTQPGPEQDEALAVAVKTIDAVLLGRSIPRAVAGAGPLSAAQIAAITGTNASVVNAVRASLNEALANGLSMQAAQTQAIQTAVSAGVAPATAARVASTTATAITAPKTTMTRTRVRPLAQARTATTTGTTTSTTGLPFPGGPFRMPDGQLFGGDGRFPRVVALRQGFTRYEVDLLTGAHRTSRVSSGSPRETWKVLSFSTQRPKPRTFDIGAFIMKVTQRGVTHRQDPRDQPKRSVRRLRPRRRF